MTWRTIVAMLGVGLLAGVLACDPPEQADDDAEEGAQAQEIDEDGPSDLEHHGITEYSDDPALIEEGEELFTGAGACSACHGIDSDRPTGPALSGISERRSAAWVARMILHPAEMQDRDPQLTGDFPAPMTPNTLEPEQVEAVVAYLGAN